jgi:ATP-dependent Clp protease protease subunit
MDIKITDKRDFFLKEKCDMSSMTNLIEKINEINQEDQRNIAILKNEYNTVYKPNPMNLYINTYGGDVYPTFGLIDVILTSKTPVNTICTGLASSCGLLILLAGKERMGYKNSSYLIHSISTFAIGDLQSLEDRVEESKRLHGLIVNHIISSCNITQEEIDDIKKLKKDFFFDSDLALEKGIIHKIIQK